MSLTQRSWAVLLSCQANEMPNAVRNRAGCLHSTRFCATYLRDFYSNPPSVSLSVLPIAQFPRAKMRVCRPFRVLVVFFVRRRRVETTKRSIINILNGSVKSPWLPCWSLLFLPQRPQRSAAQIAETGMPFVLSAFEQWING